MISELKELDPRYIAKTRGQFERRTWIYNEDYIFSKARSIRSIDRSIRLMEQFQRLYTLRSDEFNQKLI